MIRGKVLPGGRKKTNERKKGKSPGKRKTLNPDTPKRIPITLSDTDTLSDFSSHRKFSQPTQE
jgi:hypothetical protein